MNEEGQQQQEDYDQEEYGDEEGEQYAED